VARDFPGTAGNYLDAGDVSAIDITGTALTIAVWAFPDNLNDRMLIAKDGGGANTIQYRIWHANGSVQMQFDIGDSTNFDNASGGSITTGAWQHFALVKNGTGAGALKGYKNAGEVASGTSNRTIANQAATLRFGGRSADGFGPFDGKLADIGIWDAALTVAELSALAKGVSPLFVRPANLKGYWPMWGVGSPEADLSGNANNATVTGTVPVGDHAPVGMAMPAPFVYDFEAPSVAYLKAGTGIAGLLGAGLSESIFIEAGRALVGADGHGIYSFTSTGSTYTKAGHGIVGTVGAGGGRLRVQPLGVSIGFGDTVLEPYPTWVRIDA